jgi:hypothetical protein
VTSTRPVGRRAAACLTAAALVASALVACSSSAADDDYVLEDCTRADVGNHSVARLWDDALLDAIRRDTPAPTVHARNLFHTSAAMWDAWAAYDPAADGYFVTEKIDADDPAAAREAAISYAAYRILLWRYSRAAGMQETFDELTATMESLCYDIGVVTTEGESPAALGNRIAAAAIEYGLDDGSLEETRYVDTSYRSANPPMVVGEPGTDLVDPDRWQPLALARLVAQNGEPLAGSVQRYIGPQWGNVRGFALPASADGMPIDPGQPPVLDETDDDYQQAALDVIRKSGQLDPTDGVVIDISPRSLGDSTLGTNDGDGYDENPTTGEPYEARDVPQGDYTRVLTEFWADGPASETPPGHWNTIANAVTDTPDFERRVGGEGPEVDPLEWDVKMYFALNGAVHDAAVAAWGAKRHYDSVRPISMIRYLSGRGQSSDPDGPAYDPDGLPLEPGLVEIVTPESSAPGERHEQLADHVGEVTILAWAGSPDDPANDASGVDWILGVDWVPYQLPTFVTPAFPGYVSGHSTFSRAAAEVMTDLTGTPYFPGGLWQHTVEAGSLHNEAGPSEDITLEAATYYDAADQAGISRLYGGIHIAADDFGGRQAGSQCGTEAWALAQRYFDGTAP